jgi:hypothetical protein
MLPSSIMMTSHLSASFGLPKPTLQSIHLKKSKPNK